jgi:GNAT superfamily N-acetyltransferase
LIVAESYAQGPAMFTGDPTGATSPSTWTHDGPMTSLRFRSAGAADAEQIATLHADSWRRHYRGAYADSFLDGDLPADRLTVWSSRLAVAGGTATILAEREGRLVGFIHVVFDDDPGWGSLVDNLHVVPDQHRTGVGSRLLARSARAVTERATGPAMYLWVLRQNTAAQRFYLWTGATCVEAATVPPPGGDPTRLNGTPGCLRMAWPDASRLSDLVGDRPPRRPRSGRTP